MALTERLRASNPADLTRAASLLRAGALVAFPTETVYGLGAHALDREAVIGIFTAKGRPQWDPFIVHIAEAGQLAALTAIPTALNARVTKLVETFWPGPLTLLLPRSAAIPDEVTAGRSRVGVRVPAHPVAQALLRAAGIPIAAPSANRFGHISPTRAAHVLDDLDGRIDAVLDGGPTSVGVESTVLDPEPTPMIIYRAGAVTAEQLTAVLGVQTRLYVPDTPLNAEPSALPSPGVGIRHYAPGVPLSLTEPDLSALQAAIDGALSAGSSVGVLLPRDWTLRVSGDLVIQPWGKWTDPAFLGEELFAALRALETKGVAEIICPLPPPGGVREALRDRLTKAARPR